jgi:tetratricopeptide (TPR) repeat protein
MGIAYDEQNLANQAVSEFQEALKKDPQMPDMRFAVGFLYWKKHDEANARQWLEDELSISLCHAAAYYYLGEIQRQAEHPDAAVTYYRRSISCNPAFAEAYLGLGIVLQAQQRVGEALHALREAARRAPDKSEAHFHLAQVLAKVGLAEQAKIEFQMVRALKSAENDKAAAKLRMGSDDLKLETLVK